MPDLLSLPLRAADLVIRPVTWALGQVLDLVRPDEEDTPTPRPTPPPEPARASSPPKAAGPARPKPKPKATAKPKPKPKPKRAPARSEPTRGEVAALREQQREAEQNAGGPGPGAVIDVAAPWDGYDAMTEDDVLERLIGADSALRAIVRLYESQHGGRRQILIATETVTAQP